MRKIMTILSAVVLCTGLQAYAATITQTVGNIDWNADIWGTSAAAPTTGNDYVTATGVSGDRIRIGADGNSSTFGGDSLTVVSGTRALVKLTDGTTATVNGDLVLDGGWLSLAPNSGNGTSTLDVTQLRVDSASEIGIAQSAQTLVIDGILTGSGNITLTYDDGTAGGGRKVVFNSISGYTGAIDVTEGMAIEFGVDYVFANSLNLGAGSVFTVAHTFTFDAGNLTIDGVAIAGGTYAGGSLAALGANFDDAGGTLVIEAAEPVLTYHFDGDFADSSSSANHGAASGAAGLTSDTNNVPVGTGALQLDGADNSYVALSNTIVFSATEPWSVAFWAQRGESGADKSMIMGELGTSDDFIWLNDNFDGLRFRSSTANTLDFTVAQDLDFHHYALVADGAGNLTLYVDGLFGETLNGNTSFRIDTVGQAYSGGTYGFLGILDETRVYQGTLTGSEVLDLYNEKPQSPGAVVTRVRVFLLGGQSNTDGRADPSNLPITPVNLQQPQRNIDFYYKTEGHSGVLTTLRPGCSETSGFGPTITFGHDINALLNRDSTTRVALVKYANGGTLLATDWKAGGDATTSGDGPDYVTFQQTVTDGMAALNAAYTGAVVKIEGMIWHQGESDTSADTYANAYAANLAEFIADIRATYGTNLPFVVGRLSTLQTALDATRLETVRQAQTTVAEADPFTGLVGTDPFPLLGDNLHYNADGQQSMGSAFARQLGYQLWIPGLFTPEQLVAGEAEPGVDADSDGVSNEDEFIAGTLPGDAASLLQVELWPTGSNLFEIRHPGAADRLFAVESTTNLVDGAWIDLLPWAQGNGAVVTRSVTNSGSQGFMRVRATLP